MILSAKREVVGERHVLPWEVFGTPNVEGGGFIYPTRFGVPYYALACVRLVGLDDELAERIHGGDTTVYQEIAEGPDKLGTIRLIGCHATTVEHDWHAVTTDILREFAPFTNS